MKSMMEVGKVKAMKKYMVEYFPLLQPSLLINRILGLESRNENPFGTKIY